MESGHYSSLRFRHEDIEQGDFLFLLGCEKKLIREIKNKNRHNLIVHESFLPKGRGWSPLTWQVLEGAKCIPVSLFEAEEYMDSGPIYLQETLKLNGNELIDELREGQGNLTIKLCMKYVQMNGVITGRIQEGEPTYYKRRRPSDSLVDLNKSIIEQFNLLRTCDNDRYPAHFYHNNEKFILKIYKDKVLDGFNFSCRKIKREDLEQVLIWRNSDSVRLNMFHQEIISWKEHISWFNDLGDHRKCWVFLVNGVVAGVFYCSLLNLELDSWGWSCYLGNPDLNRGLGVKMGLIGLRELFEVEKVRELHAEVIVSNKRSINFHRKIGMILDKELYHEKSPLGDVACSMLKINRESWFQNADRLFDLYFSAKPSLEMEGQNV